ncbi:3'-5' exonuclease [Empedobacter falsenii]|uniref:3'-5' exonuclease n=1 Tax=Empedobacter falsenii TaxID=343874 RepID=UPI003530C87C
MQTKPPGLNVNVYNFHSWAYQFLKANGLVLYNKLIKSNEQNLILSKLKNKHLVIDSKLFNKNNDFYIEEFSWIKGKLFDHREKYIEAKRTGRGTTDRITKEDKELIWNIYEEYIHYQKENDKVDFDDYALLCLKIIDSNPNFIPPFTHIIVDEAQDLNKAQILVITKLVSEETKSISIIADAAQRIYKSGFTWAEIGFDFRGRSIAFKKNYRNTKSIADAAKSLLDKEQDKTDFTDIESARDEDINIKPIIGNFNNYDEQNIYLIQELNNIRKNENLNSTVILHRTRQGLKEIEFLLNNNNIPCEILNNSYGIDFLSDKVKICTLSSVKGLEFDNVFIVDVNDDVIPYPPGFNEPDDEFHISTERRLLYTAMTRAREKLYILSSDNPSRYLNEIDVDLVDYVNDTKILYRF